MPRPVKPTVPAAPIRMRDPRELRPNPRNPRKHPKRQIEALRESYRRYGFLGVIVVGADDVIAAGHARQVAAIEEGIGAVPTIDASHLSADDVRAFLLADNAIGAMSEWDKRELEAELQSLGDAGIDLKPFDLAFVPADPADAEKAAKRAQIEDAPIQASFWISVQGPFAQQPAAIAAIKALAGIEGVTVHSNVRADA